MPPIGSLGSLNVDQTGTATLHLASDKLKVSSVIGRSVVVSSTESKKWYVVLLLCNNYPCTFCRLMCGVIARSAGLFQNSKRLCTCDGVSIWDEAQRR